MSDQIVPARPAATILLLRDGAAGLEVFMVRRHEGIEYLGGSLVFPGGRVDEADRRLAEVHAHFDLPNESLSWRIAAVRETFEEAGVLLARPAGSEALIPNARLAGLVDWRKAIHGNAAALADLLARENLELALDLLVPYGHWITPKPAPKRFDTHFFAVAAPPDQEPLHDGHEMIESRWVAPRQALDEAVARTVQIAFPTRMNLKLLLPVNDVAAALAATRARRIVTVAPDYDAQGRRVSIPPEAGYGPDVLSGEG